MGTGNTERRRKGNYESCNFSTTAAKKRRLERVSKRHFNGNRSLAIEEGVDLLLKKFEGKR